MSKRFISISLVLAIVLSLFSFSEKTYAEIDDFEYYEDEMDSEEYLYGDAEGYADEYVHEKDEFPELNFTDLDEDAWYMLYVYMVNYDGIMVGKSKEIFDPLGNVTMAELATISAKIHSKLMVSKGEIKTENAELWYMPYVEYCYENGIYNDKNVDNGRKTLKNCQDWNRAAKRNEVAGMLGRCDNFYKKGFINPDVPLTDIQDISSDTKFSEEILILYRAGVAVGDENMRFHPDDKVTRAEMAAMITRILHDEFKIELPKG